MRTAVVLAILIALTAVAVADDDVRPGQAERLMEEGRALFVRDADYAGALDRFRRAYALAPSWQALATGACSSIPSTAAQALPSPGLRPS